MGKNKKEISFDHNIIGHKRILKLLKNSIQTNRLSHAYLFVGPKHVGKTMVACKFVEELFKSSGQVSKLHLKSHPDFLVISEDKIIKIDQIRELQHRLNLKPVSSPYKICIIENAELMNKEAGNCLLKTLEEPPGQAILILIARNENQLLPTIRSRCEILKFQIVPPNLIKNELLERGANPTQTEKITEFSKGRIGLAIKAFNNQKVLREYEEIKEELKNIATQNLAFRFTYINKISKSDSLVKKVLDVWLSSFRKTLLGEKIKGEIPTYGHSQREIYEIIEKIVKTKNLLKLSVNLRLALENLVLMF